MRLVSLSTIYVYWCLPTIISWRTIKRTLWTIARRSYFLGLIIMLSGIISKLIKFSQRLMMLLGTGESLTIQSNKSISASCAVASVERCPFLPGHNLQVIYPWVQRSLSHKIEWLDLCINRRSCYLISSRRGRILQWKMSANAKRLGLIPHLFAKQSSSLYLFDMKLRVHNWSPWGGGWQIHCLDQLKL